MPIIGRIARESGHRSRPRRRIPDSEPVHSNSELKVGDLERIQGRGLSSKPGASLRLRAKKIPPTIFAMGWMGKKRVGFEERALAALAWMARRRRPAERLPAHLATGIEGETAGYHYLRRRGYHVVARRWSSGDIQGDIDLIAWQGTTLCFIEVKTRTARDASPAEIAVDAQKRTVLRRLARRYVSQLPRETAPPLRFDVLSVYLVPGEKKEFAHFEGAFGWSEREER